MATQIEPTPILPGHAHLYGPMVYRKPRVYEAIEVLKEETTRTMGLLGY